MADAALRAGDYSGPQPPGITHAAGAVVFLRIMSSLAWLDSAFVGKDAKFAATFLSGAGLTEAITQKFIHTAVTPTVANFLQNIVLPHAVTFAWLIAFGDLAIGLSLSLGLFTRLGGALAIARAMTNILIAAGAGPDTIGFNAMLIVAAAICIATGAGKYYGIDGFLIARWPNITLLRAIT